MSQLSYCSGLDSIHIGYLGKRHLSVLRDGNSERKIPVACWEAELGRTRVGLVSTAGNETRGCGSHITEPPATFRGQRQQPGCMHERGSSASARQFTHYTARRNCCHHFCITLARPISFPQETAKRGAILPFGETSNITWLTLSDRRPPPGPLSLAALNPHVVSLWLTALGSGELQKSPLLLLFSVSLHSLPSLPCARQAAEILLGQWSSPQGGHLSASQVELCSCVENGCQGDAGSVSPSIN